MKNLKKPIGVLLAVVLCLGLATTGVLAVSDDGEGSATLGEINEILMTDAAISFNSGSTITASSGNNAIATSVSDVLTGSTENSSTPVFWSANVTAVTMPDGAVKTDAEVRDYIYWSQSSGNATYPACIDVDATDESGCTITTAWADAGSDTLPAGTGDRHAVFTVSYHNWADGTGDAVSTANYSVVFTTASTVYVKEGSSDWQFTDNSTDLSANATALTVSAGTGETNYVTGVIGDSGATYVLTILDTSEGSERVVFALGKWFDFTGSTQTQDFYSLVDFPNRVAAGDYTWTITLTTVKWDVN